MPAHTITIYGRPECHLCDDAEERIAQLLGDFVQQGVADVRVDVINIEHDDDLLKQHLEKIPVVEVDGERLAELVQYRRKPFADALLAALQS